MVYEWKTKGLYKLPADVAGKEVEQCRNANGEITPFAVVERAKPEDNPLHGCFEWDDNRAAEKWREQEARVMIANIVTVIKTESEEAEPITVRAFVHVNNDADSNGGYKAITHVLKCESDRDYMLSRAFAELKSFHAKYSVLSELTGVFDAIKGLEGLRGLSG